MTIIFSTMIGCNGWFIAEDPHQFSDADTEWLNARLRTYDIRRAWGKLSEDDECMQSIMLAELQTRAVCEGILREAGNQD